jgi:large subunit ribosomal protein L21
LKRLFELTFNKDFRIISSFRLLRGFSAGGEGDTNEMSYAIIRTGGKQYPVTEGQTLRVPTIDGKEGGKVDIEALVAGEGKDAKIGGATVKATVVGHGKDDKIIVFKKKRRKQYKRRQGHRQGFTEIKIEKI